jgi:hypothetical protein
MTLSPCRLLEGALVDHLKELVIVAVIDVNARIRTATAQTPGSQCRAALAPNLGVKTGLWGGLFIGMNVLGASQEVIGAPPSLPCQ